MHTTLLVIKAWTPCWIPFSKTLQQKSKDSFTSSHNFQWQATVPRLRAHIIWLCPPITVIPKSIPKKAKTHAGILGIKCADAIAKCSVENQRGRGIHINTDAHPHSSIFWPAMMENPPPAYLPDTLNICQPGPLTDRVSIFSAINAVKAHMHAQQNLDPK
jgi:hypothetical protein